MAMTSVEPKITRSWSWITQKYRLTYTYTHTHIYIYIDFKKTSPKTTNRIEWEKENFWKLKWESKNEKIGFENVNISGKGVNRKTNYV